MAEPRYLKTIAVGMSGGVDSSVAALLLKQQGYQVIGLFMKNWEEKDENGVCTSAKDFEDVARVCEKLEIPYYGVEFIEEYREQVFARFLREYQRGFTPNPDVLCNREIKFDVFLAKAESLGADALATGHYCRLSEGKLLKGSDPGKDQSYFLHAVPGAKLRNVLFPIGDLIKSEVRELARAHGLLNHAKKDSTGICFIGERKFRPFLSNYLAAKPGELKRLNGEVVGSHAGAAFYTLGQRRGLGLGGEGERWFVVAKDSERNLVFVERGEDHPALYADWLEAEELSWISGAAPQSATLFAKTRYRQADQACRLTLLEDGRARVDFDEAQRALTPGQSVVFYDGDVCLGGGTIRKIGPSHYDLSKQRVQVQVTLGSALA